jgi:hypothetical protein
MVFNTWSHSISGLWAASGILNTRKHSVLGEGKTEIQLDSFSETLCFLVFRIPNDGSSPESQ